MYTEDIHIGEWIVDLWGRDEEGTLISECSFGGFAEAEWEDETTMDILRFWKLTKVDEKVWLGRFRGLRKTRYGGVWDWSQSDKEASFPQLQGFD